MPSGNHFFSDTITGDQCDIIFLLHMLEEVCQASRFRIFFCKEMPAIKRVTAYLNGFVTPRPLGGLLRRIRSRDEMRAL